MSLRSLSVLIALITIVSIAIYASADLAEFILPVIGAAAVVLFTLAIATMPDGDDRASARPDETERHHW
jgi:hypothetical protein